MSSTGSSRADRGSGTIRSVPPDRPPGVARRAGVADAGALTDLRAIMLDALAEGPSAAGDDRWRAETAAWFREHLADRDRMAAFVVDDPDLGTVASALGAVSLGAPLPGEPSRRRGQVFSVATDPRARRRGYARACTEAVLVWLDGRDVPVVDLSATPDGVTLYRELGFAERPWPSMRRRR